MKKTIALLLAVVMIIGLCACGGGTTTESKAPESNAPESNAPETPDGGDEKKEITIGIVCIGDENDQGYTYNFMRGVDDVTESLAADGITVNWIPKYNVLENSGCEDACIELADEGCDIIITNSYGHEPFMLKVAGDYPEIHFIGATNLGSVFDDLDNTHNAFANIYEGRYACGVIAGMKLQELIDAGEITPEEAVIGYVGAFAYAEVVSGFTAFYLGARSVCPSVTMNVQYVSSWSNPTEEANAAQALIDLGAVVISQHSDNTTPATTAQQNGVFHCGYNNDMITVAPNSSLISCRIDWSVYFDYVIRSVLAGEEFSVDWTAGMPEGAVVVTALNENIAAEGSAAKLDEIVEGLHDGSINVFAGPWTGTGTAFGADAPDTMTVPEGEHFEESDVENGQTSAPYFYWIIDGITEINN